MADEVIFSFFCFSFSMSGMQELNWQCGFMSQKPIKANFMIMVMVFLIQLLYNIYLILFFGVMQHSFLWSANKFWSGLLENYYLPRASMYFSYLAKALTENKNFKLEEWRREWISYSNKWQAGKELYPVRAKGDTLAISRALYEKYFNWEWFE